jgi:predicted chitinase
MPSSTAHIPKQNADSSRALRRCVRATFATDCTFADKDDVVGLTKRINGGVNGLAHRRGLLNKANGLLTMLSLSGEALA